MLLNNLQIVLRDLKRIQQVEKKQLKQILNSLYHVQ